MDIGSRDKRQRTGYSNTYDVGEDVLGHGRDATKNFDIWINCGLYSFEDEDGGAKRDRRGRKRSKSVTSLLDLVLTMVKTVPKFMDAAVGAKKKRFRG